MIKIEAHPLHDRPAGIRPSHIDRDGGQKGSPGSVHHAGWDIVCPHAFEATWNGGPRPEDVEIRVGGTDVDRPPFVQSQLGEGKLTFYPGYQFKTEAEWVLWVRGPINAPKDGLAPLESIVDASLLPCTVTIDWQFTRPHQTVRFEAGEPFATLLPWPKSGPENAHLEVVRREEDEAAHERAFQEMADSPALRDVLARLGAAPAAAEARDAKPAPQTWADRLENPPPVSCICPTYGRVELLEEAIYSFLQQDYRGEKELIVLNDYEQQTLEFDHPEVRIVNLPKRLHSVGETFKAAAALASHDLVFVWHDDDIYLPHRLSYSVAHCDDKTSFFKADKAWFWNQGQLGGPAQNRFHGGSCWRRDLFRQVHGYPHIGTGYDAEFEELCREEAPGAMHVDPIAPADIYYIYRWSGTGSYHLSAMGVRHSDGAGRENQDVAAYVEEQAAKGQIPQGQIRLQPRWKSDYSALVADAVHPPDYLAAPPAKRENGRARDTGATSGVHSPPARFLDTLDGRIDLQEFEPGFFRPERFFDRPREDYLKRYGEVYRRDFYVIDALKLAYLSVPKAACTAIKLALAKAIGIAFEPDQDVEYVVHFHPQWHREQGGLREAQSGYYRFGFVRNPFDRLVSCYRSKIVFKRSAKTQVPLYESYYFDLPVNVSFADFTQRVSRIPDALADAHFKSQHALLYRGDELQVDFVGRVERLDRDWKPIAARYGLDPLLAHSNVTKDKPGCHSDYRLYYTESLVQLVYERYRRDVELFGYQEDYENLLEFVQRRERDAVPEPGEGQLRHEQELES